MTRFTEMGRHVAANPSTVFTDLLQGIADDKTITMLTVTSSHNMKTRCNGIMSAIFSQYVDRTDELRTQLDLVDKTCTECVELMLLTQYGDDSANVSWAQLSKGVAMHIADRARREAGPPGIGS